MNSRNHQTIDQFGAFRKVPRTGVIYVMTQAKLHGYQTDSCEWVNFGQGQPEAGQLPGAPERVSNISVTESTAEYSPVSGVYELKEAVAEYYNRTYRLGMSSQYKAENVAISPGGRAGLTRIAATLGPLNLGHFLPDYTAYEELLGTFKSFTPIPISLDPEIAYKFTSTDLEKEILGRGLGALLLSNPCNPTGQVIQGEELKKWVEVGCRLNCALIMDEFYSRYIWNKNQASKDFTQVSAAEFVTEVNKDPVIIVDGLTKNWRYPGWRVSWTVGPKQLITAISSAGSYLDGGASHPVQEAAIPLLSKEHCENEARAIQNTFAVKRDLLIKGLTQLGIEIEAAPEGTFYIWANLKNLPEAINTGMSFFEKALEHKVITVPGEFFDVNPGKRRFSRPSRFKHHSRMSFGPSESSINLGLQRLKKFIQSY